MTKGSAFFLISMPASQLEWISFPAMITKSFMENMEFKSFLIFGSRPVISHLPATSPEAASLMNTPEVRQWWISFFRIMTYNEIDNSITICRHGILWYIKNWDVNQSWIWQQIPGASPRVSTHSCILNAPDAVAHTIDVTVGDDGVSLETDHDPAFTQAHPTAMNQATFDLIRDLSDCCVGNNPDVFWLVLATDGSYVGRDARWRYWPGLLVLRTGQHYDGLLLITKVRVCVWQEQSSLLLTATAGACKIDIWCKPTCSKYTSTLYKLTGLCNFFSFM